eukprot:Platyproteum_vivax@DN6587_c0_g2_i1.p1
MGLYALVSHTMPYWEPTALNNYQQTVLRHIQIQKPANPDMKMLCIVVGTENTAVLSMIKSWGTGCDRVVAATSKIVYDGDREAMDQLQSKKHLPKMTFGIKNQSANSATFANIECNNEWARLQLVWRYLQAYGHLETYDWVVMADQWTYVITDNLKHKLATQSVEEGRLFGLIQTIPMVLLPHMYPAYLWTGIFPGEPNDAPEGSNGTINSAILSKWKDHKDKQTEMHNLLNNEEAMSKVFPKDIKWVGIGGSAMNRKAALELQEAFKDPRCPIAYTDFDLFSPDCLFMSFCLHLKGIPVETLETPNSLKGRLYHSFRTPEALDEIDPVSVSIYRVKTHKLMAHIHHFLNYKTLK